MASKQRHRQKIADFPFGKIGNHHHVEQIICSVRLRAEAEAAALVRKIHCHCKKIIFKRTVFSVFQRCIQYERFEIKELPQCNHHIRKFSQMQPVQRILDF